MSLLVSYSGADGGKNEDGNDALYVSISEMLSSKFGVAPSWSQATSFVPSKRGGTSVACDGSSSPTTGTSFIVVFSDVLWMVSVAFDSAGAAMAVVVLIVKVSSEVTSVPSASVNTLFAPISTTVVLTLSDSLSAPTPCPKTALPAGKREEVVTTSPPDTSMSVLLPLTIPSSALIFINSSPAGVSIAVPFHFSPTNEALVRFLMLAT
mmetsp:Transcript_15097/g.36241  ORF Transcript_15097/g.36241 Transcript_15097/m.36241 type:complete len:208 (-) Transcript_15097:2140-2763(-)